MQNTRPLNYQITLSFVVNLSGMKTLDRLLDVNAFLKLGQECCKTVKIMPASADFCRTKRKALSYSCLAAHRSTGTP
jgi:hypothetical protein